MKHLLRKQSFGLYLATGACLLFADMLNAQTWTSLNGPQVASNVKDISITSSGSTLYVADANHVLKSTNDGAGWAVTSQPYSSPLLVLVKPNDGSIVLAAKNGELKYNNQGGGGSGWTTISNLADLTPLCLVAAVNDNTVMLLGRTYVSNNNAIWRSSNSGASWSKVTTFGASTNVHDFDTYPTAGQGRDGVILAGGINPSGAPEGSSNSSPATTSGLWKSADYGANWDQNGLGNRNVRSVAIVPKPSATDYIRLAADNVAAGNDALMRNTSLTDDGQWTQITLSPAPADIYLIRRKASNGNIFLAASNGVWKSTDDGASFTQVGLSGTDVISLAVSSTGNNVFAGTANTLYKSTDNGSNWTEVGKMNVSSTDGKERAAKK